MDDSSSKPHVILISSPGLGHLIPVLELGKRLGSLHNLDVTILIVASQTSATESEIIRSAMSPKLCEVIELSPPNISGLVNPDAPVVTVLAVIMREMKPALRSTISNLNTRPTVLIVDLFGTESLEIADELQIPKYVYIASNAWFLALTVYIPTLDKLVEGQYVDQKDPFEIPGCKSVRPEDVVDPMLDRNDRQYFEYLRIGKEIPGSEGILVNTWEDLQPTALAALRDGKLLGQIVKSPIYTIGPMVRPVTPAGLENEIFDWLDKQPSDSVLYVALGSGGTLSYEQMIELACGLELSQQRFIWVVRKPTLESSPGSFFTAGSGAVDDLSNYFPEGFLTRTQSRGLLILEWGDQVEILSHPSVGGFLSHCGWNSVLESISNGVPIIAWPLYAEQRMNASLLTEELGVAVRSKILPANGVVGREEIMTIVRRIMVDEERHGLKGRVKELQRSAEKVWSEGGSSYDTLYLLSKGWEMSQTVKAP